MLNENLKKDQAEWLLEVYQPRMNGRVDGSTMDIYFLPARKLLTGKEINKPSCGCEFKVFAQVTNSIFGQYKTEIEKIANKRTRGKVQK